MRAAVRIELARALRPRWLLVAGARTVLYALAFGTVFVPEEVPTATNMWDVAMQLLSLPTTFFLMAAWCGVMASEVLADRDGLGVDGLMAVRVAERTRWLAKAATIMVVGALVGLGLWGAAAGVGALTSDPAWHLSEWGKASYDPLGTALEQARTYGPPPIAGVPLLGTALVACYQGVAVGVFTATVAAIVQRWARPWLCPLIVVLSLVTSFFLGLRTLGMFNPLLQMVWVLHTPVPDAYLPWVTVLPLVVLAGLVIVLAGPMSLRRHQRTAA